MGIEGYARLRYEFRSKGGVEWGLSSKRGRGARNGRGWERRAAKLGWRRRRGVGGGERLTGH